MAGRFILVAVLVLSLAVFSACGSAEPVEVPEPTPGEATGLDGATILNAKCVGCHGLDVVEAEELDAVGWAAVIDDMIARGADVSTDEAAALAEYLSLQ
ncbi:MAG: cytochrome c [Coriobacteriia bacterium]|nr:cytochrome c [Coriobacteriia bacterium]